ncbi:hypothetical protein PUNSTDRAFT_102532 [Punctularia strigosozonata HHB-11173 SS5]|uniref:uncharacterized protein n=1 Tax=Punctularia strigosozonata (strain HHB-11173) TaxID=741275 RepID=UPI0004417E69|nr:uncharacterized protein PUNSTDRAFT_102532 [Punctularia strigosozonata HHB-11173 SS5]EIN08993.1 hypothetical protein PUNSTDRAFT_102532 [Punctularia strigosozonata HHB-11173 SS5]
MSEQITLYTAKICPYAHRTELALEEAGAEYEKYQIDLQNKPEWYAPLINPASKVPAITYGGPKVDPATPSPESAKIAESLVLVEFFADLFPESTILPKDPLSRARARFFVEVVSSKLIPRYYAFGMRGESYEPLLQAFEEVQRLLPNDAKYAVGDDFTLADIALLPFIARMWIMFENDIGGFPPGEGRKFINTLQTDPKYARINQYIADVTARPSFLKTFDKAYVTSAFATRFGHLRAQKQVA